MNEYHHGDIIISHLSVNQSDFEFDDALAEMMAHHGPRYLSNDFTVGLSVGYANVFIFVLMV